MTMDNTARVRHDTPALLDAEQFRRQGHLLIDQLGEFLSHLDHESLKVEHSAETISRLLGEDPPAEGLGEEALFSATQLLCHHAVSTSNPRFWGYIMGSASPLAALADLLAAVVSPPMTSYSTSALTVSIEAQTVRWIANLIGYDASGSGLFLSGGSIANFCALRLALQQYAGFDVRSEGVTSAQGAALRLYATHDAHSSIMAAVELAGLGSHAIHWVESDDYGCMNVDNLRQQLRSDREDGYRPFMVVGVAGSTSIGAVDPLSAIAEVCRSESVWFHADAAYGGFATLSGEASPALQGLKEADSVTVDPHKWLYMPADIGCLLTRHRKALYDTFHQGATYYADNDDQIRLGGPEVLQFRDLGPQTTRAFRALKVRISLQAIGTDGYRRMIDDDIRLAKELFNKVSQEVELEAITNNLSITTFRYVPNDLRLEARWKIDYLNKLNQATLHSIQQSGRFYPSHATVQSMFVIRVCIVNFNTTLSDIQALPTAVIEAGRRLDREFREHD